MTSDSRSVTYGPRWYPGRQAVLMDILARSTGEMIAREYKFKEMRLACEKSFAALEAVIESCVVLECFEPSFLNKLVHIAHDALVVALDDKHAVE